MSQENVEVVGSMLQGVARRGGHRGTVHRSWTLTAISIYPAAEVPEARACHGRTKISQFQAKLSKRVGPMRRGCHQRPHRRRRPTTASGLRHQRTLPSGGSPDADRRTARSRPRRKTPSKPPGCGGAADVGGERGGRAGRSARRGPRRSTAWSSGPTLHIVEVADRRRTVPGQLEGGGHGEGQRGWRARGTISASRSDEYRDLDGERAPGALPAAAAREDEWDGPRPR